MSDRYMKVILTIIALELGWIGVNQATTPASAQAGTTPVIIKGIDVPHDQGFLPVAIAGGYRQIPSPWRATIDRLTVDVDTTRPLQVTAPTSLTVRMIGPVKVETDRPLKVENVGYTPAQKPGE